MNPGFQPPIEPDDVVDAARTAAIDRAIARETAIARAPRTSVNDVDDMSRCARICGECGFNLLHLKSFGDAASAKFISCFRVEFEPFVGVIVRACKYGWTFGDGECKNMTRVVFVFMLSRIAGCEKCSSSRGSSGETFHGASIRRG